MPITLLLDLDDTLLDTNLDAFVPAYFQALSGALADLVSPEIMLGALMSGTRAMMLNLDPAKTLRQVFDAEFFPKLGVRRSSLQVRIDRFYEEDFPKLGFLTAMIPQAIHLVEWAFSEGMRVVIATNPFFPLKAIHHRLRWAGLPPEKYPFTMVTSYETFHFAKESVAYYPEILAQLGWPDDPVVMVGDDMDREVKPTLSAGVPVFWVRKNGEVSEDLPGIPQGPLESLRGWLESTNPETLKVKFENPQALLANLRSTPAGLASLTARLTADEWKQVPAPGEWSLTEIACHLRDVEREVNLPRIFKVISGGNPFIPGEVTDTWVKERHCADQDGLEALNGFTAARKEVLENLDGLIDEWANPARHAIFGPTNLQELVGIIAGHDRVHIQQVWKSLP